MTDAPSATTEQIEAAQAVFTLSRGAFITAIFGFFWLGWGMSANRAFGFKDWILLDLAAILLFGAAIHSLRRSKATMASAGARRDAFWKKNGKQFKIVIVLEVIGGGVVLILSVMFHRFDLLAAGVSLVVGMHFLPLARLFGIPVYYATGTVIILCDLLSTTLLRYGAITLVVGLCTGIALWVTSVYALLCSHQLRKGTA